jgi:hypothetical protein
MKIGSYRAQFRKAKNPITDGPSTKEAAATAAQIALETAEREAAAKVRMDALRAKNKVAVAP